MSRRTCSFWNFEETEILLYFGELSSLSYNFISSIIHKSFHGMNHFQSMYGKNPKDSKCWYQISHPSMLQRGVVLKSGTRYPDFSICMEVEREIFSLFCCLFINLPEPLPHKRTNPIPHKRTPFVIWIYVYGVLGAMVDPGAMRREPSVWLREVFILTPLQTSNPRLFRTPELTTAIQLQQ